MVIFEFENFVEGLLFLRCCTFFWKNLRKKLAVGNGIINCTKSSFLEV